MKENPLKKPKMKKTIAKDRISNLPDSVMCHILSFLDMNQVLQTSLVSKRWKYLWKYVPSLSFDFPLGNTSNSGKRFLSANDCMNFVDGALYLHDKSSSIQKFKLCHADRWDWNWDFERLKIWSMFAATLQVKEVHIEYVGTKTKLSPDFWFSSDVEVITLKLDLQLLLSLYSARNLRTLELDSVLLPQGDFDAPIITFGSNLPALQTLIIKYHGGRCLKVLDISSSRLENLTLEHCHGDNNPFTLKLRTPNLRSFQFTGCCSVMDYSPEDVASLVSVKIRSNGNLHSDCLIKFLEGFSKLTALEISAETWKAFSGDHQLNHFPTLEHLKLFSLRTTTDSCIETIANFLRSTPCIEKIVLEMHKGNSAGDWGVLSSFKHRFCHLRHVTFKKLQGYKHELTFLKFILRSDVVLESITATSRSRLKHRKRVLRENLGRRLNLFKRRPHLSNTSLKMENNFSSFRVLIKYISEDAE